eukprot:364891-Chlamydomonas_euryale.AAC.14
MTGLGSRPAWDPAQRLPAAPHPHTPLSPNLPARFGTQHLPECPRFGPQHDFEPLADPARCPHALCPPPHTHTHPTSPWHPP